jgi:hypothetical protein
VPGNPLIGAYLAALHRRLPPGPADEVADGLLEAYQHYLGRGEDADAAARAAIAETGDVTVITAEFTRQAPGRRTARLLLATGPVMGACWGTALISARAWAWPVPPGARIAFATALLLAIAGLALAGASRHGYRRTRLTAPAGAGLVILDTAMITAALLAAPALTASLILAAAASTARIAYTIRSLPAIAAS